MRLDATSGQWATVTVYANLASGANTIKLVYATAGPASSGGLHVDKIDITRPETRAYNPAGQLTQRADATGVPTFSWNTNGQLTATVDPVTGTARALNYNDAGQPCLATFNSATPAPGCARQTGTHSRALSFDTYGRVATDTRHDTSNTETYSGTYGYYANGAVQQEVIAPAAVSGSGNHTYTYDQADRVTSWAGPAGAVNYGYDNAGNRTTAGAETFACNARNQQTAKSGAPQTPAIKPAAIVPGVTATLEQLLYGWTWRPSYSECVAKRDAHTTTGTTAPGPTCAESTPGITDSDVASACRGGCGGLHGKDAARPWASCRP